MSSLLLQRIGKADCCCCSVYERTPETEERVRYYRSFVVRGGSSSQEYVNRLIVYRIKWYSRTSARKLLLVVEEGYGRWGVFKTCWGG